jgi:hypothetical protein
MQRFIMKLEEVNATDITPMHVRTATLVRLPFHLRTGLICRVADPDNDRLHVWLRNKLSIPQGSDESEASCQVASLSPEEFHTDALIVNDNPELAPSEIDAVRTGIWEKIGVPSLRNPGFRLLNEIIGAHQMVCIGPYLTGIGAMWPRMLTEREVFERLLTEIVLIVEPDRAIDEDIVLRVFAGINRLPVGLRTCVFGDCRDYSTTQIESLKDAVRKIRNHAFYELKANAIAAMLRGDVIVAVVLACAALEGAHGAFMRIALRDKVPGNASKYNDFISGLLREQGFYSLVQLSVRVLMEAEERPADMDLERCLNGVSIRNSIMHAGIKGTGKYKVREYSQSNLSDGYGGILAVYKAFEAAVESREKPQ